MTYRNRKLRVGIVGAGGVSRYHARAITSLPFAKLIGVCDVDFKRAIGLAKQYEVPAYRSLAELGRVCPDVIHILTPPATHCELTLQAVAIGSHVLVEKPMASTTEECDQMIRAAARSRRLLSVNHSARMDPVVLRALDLVRKGACGDVISVDFLRSSDYPPYCGGEMPPHYRNPSYPFQDLGVHGLCLLETFLGSIKNLEVRCSSSGRKPILAFDEWHVLAQCEKGMGRIYLSWNVQPLQNELIIHGTHGVMHVDCYLQICTLRPTLRAPKQAQRVYGAVMNSVSTIAAAVTNTARFALGSLQPSPGIHSSVRSFYFALRDNLPPPVPAEEGRRIVSWMESATRRVNGQRSQFSQNRHTELAPARILVTGASGFLGRALIAQLLRDGELPRVLLRRRSPDLESDSRIQICYGDLGNPEAVDRAVRDVAVVYHVGAATGGSREDFDCATVWGTRNVVNACVKYGVTRMVHVSSLAVLDHAGHRVGTPVTESSPLEPHPELRGYYTQSKLTAERLVVDAIRDHELPAVILRPGQIFGPGAKKITPSGAFELAGRSIVVGTGAHWLNLVYIEDLVNALVLAGTKEGIVGQTFQVVDDQAMTQREFIDACCLATHGLRVFYVPKLALLAVSVVIEMLGRLVRRPVPLSRYRLRSLAPISPFDCTAAKEILGWKPSAGCREVLRRTLGLSDVRSAPEAGLNPDRARVTS